MNQRSRRRLRRVWRQAIHWLTAPIRLIGRLFTPFERIVQ